MKNQIFKVLIIDDKPDNWLDYVKKPDKSGLSLDVTVAGNLDEARKLLKKVNFQAVISDYVLKDGICTDLISDYGQIPLIVMSSEGREDSALLALRSGATEYVIKDHHANYRKMLPLVVSKSVGQRKQALELERYRNELENIVEERTIELIEMYGKLQESEINFRNIFNSSNDGIIIVSDAYEFIEANEAMIRQLGVSREYLRTHFLINLVVPDFRPFLIETLEQVKSGIPSGIMEVEVISPGNGNLLSFEISCVPIIFNHKSAILSIIRDIGERKNHARKIFETILHTEEDERNRIARDLHDEIGPLISALKIFTNSFLEASNAEKKNKLATQVGTIVKDLIDSIKIISNDMSPHVLMNFGLFAAVQNFIDLFSRNIKINLTSDLDEIRFPKTVETLMFRIIKELINNTVKHAHANEINLELTYSNNNLVCNYYDNGIGFNWEKMVDSPGKGMGLHNIITRIRSLGGNFQVDSDLPKGFHIRFELQTITRNDAGKK